MIKAIVFDFDGVIVESVTIKTDAFLSVFQSQSPSILAQIKQFHLSNGGMSRFRKFETIYREFLDQPLSKEMSMELGRQFEQFVMHKIINAPFVPGMVEFIRAHEKQYDFYTASATTHLQLEQIGAKKKLTSFFKRIYGSPNPKALVISDVISAHQGESDKVVMIGDARSDFEAAQANQCPFILRLLPDRSNQFLQDELDIEQIIIDGSQLEEKVNLLNA